MLGNLTSCIFSLAFISSLFNQQKLYKSKKKVGNQNIREHFKSK